jgi:hydrogenase-4 component H
MMFPWVRKGLRTGVLTTRYPATPEQMAEEFRGRPVLDAERCQADRGCTACVDVCLPGALQLLGHTEDEKKTTVADGQQLVLDYGRCIMCGLCVTACPENALRMTTDYELATTTRDDLRITARFVQTQDAENEEGGTD